MWISVLGLVWKNNAKFHSKLERKGDIFEKCDYVVSHSLSIDLTERGSVPMESVSSISLFSKTFPLSVSSCVDSA